MAAAFPSAFRSRTEAQLGADEAAKLLGALDGSPSVSIRFNPYKVTSRPEGDPVPWSRYGYYLAQRPQFTLDPAFHGGAYYVQEASSMFLETIFGQFCGDGVPMRILDLCAAPGGKTTLLSTLAGAESVVVANEVIRQRAAVLADNVRKWGIGNVVVTNNDPAHFGSFGHYFDLVAVDAPCSGEGMFRKEPDARSQWSDSSVRLCAARQRRILADVWDALRPGGILIYSTCTFNREENEENVAWLCGEYDCEPVALRIDPAWGIVQGESAGAAVFRFFPHRLRGEGFFAAVLRKGDGRRREKSPKPRKSVFSELSRQDVRTLSGWVAQPEYMRFSAVGDTAYGYYAHAYPVVRQLAESLTVIHSGVRMGQLFGGKLRPDHALAMFHDLARGIVPEAELDTLQALGYLRRNDTDASLLDEGINLVTSGGLPLGWIKRIGNRSNNMYPKELRIAVL